MRGTVVWFWVAAGVIAALIIFSIAYQQILQVNAMIAQQRSVEQFEEIRSRISDLCWSFVGNKRSYRVSLDATVKAIYLARGKHEEYESEQLVKKILNKSESSGSYVCIKIEKKRLRCEELDCNATMPFIGSVPLNFSLSALVKKAMGKPITFDYSLEFERIASGVVVKVVQPTTSPPAPPQQLKFVAAFWPVDIWDQYRAMLSDTLPTQDAYAISLPLWVGHTLLWKNEQALRLINSAKEKGFVIQLDIYDLTDKRLVISNISYFAKIAGGATLIVDFSETPNSIPTPQDFNEIKTEIQSSYPSLLIGVTLPRQTDMEDYLSQGAKPDFIAGEMYGSVQLSYVNWFLSKAKDCGVPRVAMWVSKIGGEQVAQESIAKLYSTVDTLFLWGPGKVWDVADCNLLGGQCMALAECVDPSKCAPGASGCSAAKPCCCVPSYWPWSDMKKSIIQALSS